MYSKYTTIAQNTYFIKHSGLLDAFLACVIMLLPSLCFKNCSNKFTANNKSHRHHPTSM